MQQERQCHQTYFQEPQTPRAQTTIAYMREGVTNE